LILKGFQVKKPGTFDASLFDGWSRELAYLIGAVA
jgi:hypothetical protein